MEQPQLESLVLATHQFFGGFFAVWFIVVTLGKSIMAALTTAHAGGMVCGSFPGDAASTQ